MKGHAPKRSSPGASFSWHGASWTVVMGAAMYGLYCLRDCRILTEDQIMWLVLIAVPVAAALLSVARGERPRDRGGGGDPQ